MLHLSSEPSGKRRMLVTFSAAEFSRSGELVRSRCQLPEVYGKNLWEFHFWTSRTTGARNSSLQLTLLRINLYPKTVSWWNKINKDIKNWCSQNMYQTVGLLIGKDSSNLVHLLITLHFEVLVFNMNISMLCYFLLLLHYIY